MKRLLLVGGGHAQVFALRELARRRPPELAVTLVTPYERQLYSGMLPGWIAGRYSIDDLAIALQPLARAAEAELLLDRIVRIEAGERRAITARGTVLAYDLLSIASGSGIATQAIEGASRWALPLRPIEEFVAKWSLYAPRLVEADRPTITVIGAGAGGVEVTLSIAHAMRKADNGTQVQLITGGSVLSGHGSRARRLVLSELMRSKIRLVDSTVLSVASDHVDLAEGATLPSDLTLLATGPAAPVWLAGSGLALDDSGFVQVDRHLRSVSHDNVFAAGDVASIVDAPHARSGVYAVHAGPPLAENLLRQAAGKPLRRYSPQSVALYLLSTGRQHAIASWDGLAWSGDWVWRWKNRIDRAFITQFRNP